MALQTDDTDSSSNYEHELTFILSLPALHSPVSLVINDNTLQTDDTNSIIGFNIDVGSTTPAHSDTDVPQIITAPASGSVPDPAVLAPATTPAVRRRRQQSVDANDIVEGSQRRKQSKRARGEV
jgi:hypothetical protein